MAFRSLCFLCLQFILLGTSASWKPSFDFIYQFGDSVADTGNLIREDPTSPAASLPYVETFFHRPTGRLSDGLLMVDFIAKAFHLPLLNPYLESEANFSHGVKFAVAGSAALDTAVLAAKGITAFNTNSSLSVPLLLLLHLVGL